MEQPSKLSLAPWQEKGRWYKAFLESDGSNITLTTCDIPDCTVESLKLILPKNYHIVDQKHDYTTDSATAHSLSIGLFAAASGRQGITLLNAANWTSVDIWIFAYVGD